MPITLMTSIPSSLTVTDGWFAEVSPELFARGRAATPFDDFFSDVKGAKAFTAAESPIKLSPIHRSPSSTAQGKRLRPLELDDSPPSAYLRIDQPPTTQGFDVKWHAFSPASPRRLLIREEGGMEAMKPVKQSMEKEDRRASTKEADAGYKGKETVDLSAVDGALLARPCDDETDDVSDFVIDVRNSRLAATQMAALRGGRSTLLELKGAFCDDIWFGWEELLALSMFRQYE